jgi:regulatory protein
VNEDAVRTGPPQRSRRSPDERKAAADARRERRAAVTDVAIVMEAAAAHLAVRPRTVGETRRRLRQLGYQGGLREQAIDRLIELGYLDDAAYARAWIESRDRAHPRGEVALRRELRTRGVAEDVISAALSERSAAAAGPVDGHHDPVGADGASGRGDELAARRLLERRRASLEREPDPRRRRNKAYAMLARNGFDPDVCQRLAYAFMGDRLAV